MTTTKTMLSSRNTLRDAPGLLFGAKSSFDPFPQNSIFVKCGNLGSSCEIHKSFCCVGNCVNSQCSTTENQPRQEDGLRRNLMTTNV